MTTEALDGASFAGDSDQESDYGDLLSLEDLETLLEELEDVGAPDDLSQASLPPDLRGRVVEAQVTNLHGLRARIANLHERLDELS